MTGWTKREPVSNLIILGDDEGNAAKAAGLLGSLKQDTMYPSRHNYELVQRDGGSIWLAGSASLGRQLSPADIGKFIKVRFLGWGKSANGKFKDIEVLIYDGEPTAEMKQWPRWASLNQKNGEAKGAPLQHSDEAAEAEVDDDLPF